MRLRQSLVGVAFMGSLFLPGCGGDGGGDETSRLPWFERTGQWSGEATVGITAGGSVCGFFAGQYPIQWSFEKQSETEIHIYDSGSLIATGSLEPDAGVVVIPFENVVNYQPDSDEACHGSEEVILSANGDALTWSYSGGAACGIEQCRYQGSAELSYSASDVLG